MSTPNHTPGPWHVGLKPGPMVYGPQGEQIVGINVMLDRDEVLANAKFIAAAPAMYAAMGDLISLFDMRLPNGLELNQVLPKEVWERVSTVVSMAKQVKAQAEGQHHE